MLNITALIGCTANAGAGAAGGGSASVSYIGFNSDTANLTTYTFSAQSIGTAAADRLVVVGVTGIAGSGRTVSAVTIGGVAATLLGNAASSTEPLVLAAAAVPTGTTGDIVVTFSGACTSCSVAVFRAVGLNSQTALDSASASTPGSGSASVTLTSQADGIVVAVAHVNAHISWSGVTEAQATTVENAVRTSASGATSGTSKVVTLNYIYSDPIFGSGKVSAATWR